MARCLAELLNPLLYPGNSMRLEITQEEIGFLARVSHSTTTRPCVRWKPRNCSGSNIGAVQVLDLDGLKHYTGSEDAQCPPR
ncbi:Transcriptional regulator, Crp/Fnr family OS=Castellaniella defragrans (strain DSM / CCUG 39792/ 65Phen) OX=1437824 GN=BN940_03136 PE=4 SV=1 [Castellaniella denitrificans]